MRKPLLVALTAVAVLIVDFIIEKMVLPVLYKEIPTPLGYSSKPIGFILLPVTFFHLILVVPSILVILYSAEKAGYNVEDLLPKTRQAKVEFFWMILQFFLCHFFKSF